MRKRVFLTILMLLTFAVTGVLAQTQKNKNEVTVTEGNWTITVDDNATTEPVEEGKTVKISSNGPKRALNVSATYIPTAPQNVDLSTPLTLEATEDGTTITIRFTESTDKNTTITYSINDGSAQAVSTANETKTISNLKKGDWVQFKSTKWRFEATIIADKNCYVYGNVMSLINDNGDEFADDKEIAYGQSSNNSPGALESLFKEDGNKIIIDANRKLYLPATTLNKNCYSQMFAGCKSLTSAPELPATTLKDGCYWSMFANCTSLATAPNLSGENLDRYCYALMFKGCTSLAEAPELPATTVAESCYSEMLSGCTKLTKAPDLPATILTNKCYNRMFSGCTNLTKAPELPATTLTDNCYKEMFSGCTKLNYVKCLATDISASSCTSDWLNGVNASGTFVKTMNMPDWTEGNSGIPSGWSIENTGIPEGYINIATLTGDNPTTVETDKILTGTAGENTHIIIADGANVTLYNADVTGISNANEWAGITCAGDATITLKGTNTVKGGHKYYPGLHIAAGKTLTIEGSGSLTASSGADGTSSFGAGIGGGYQINCGNIDIFGGTITATGGGMAAGIGGGYESSCGTITINSGITKVTATKGSEAPEKIGKGYNGTCGTVTIGNSLSLVDTDDTVTITPAN